MSVRWTKRPQNICRTCGYLWYPRGHDLSSSCPSCGSPDVELAIVALLRALGYVIAAPFVLLAIILSLLFRAAVAIVKAISRSLSKSEGVVSRNFDQVEAAKENVALNFVVQFAKRCLLGLLFPLKWLYSVKNDLMSLTRDGEVNPIALGAKLLIICPLTILLIIGSINMMA